MTDDSLSPCEGSDDILAAAEQALETRRAQESMAWPRPLVSGLVAEVKRLREGGPWVEHVERQKAMQRERDGDCICDGNPATTSGPEEDCPWHGRPYRYWVEGLEQKSAEVERLQAVVSLLRDGAWLEPGAADLTPILPARLLYQPGGSVADV